MEQLFITEKYGIKFEIVAIDHREYLIYQMYDTDFMRSKIEEYIDYIASKIIEAGRANEDGTIDEEVFFYKCRTHKTGININNAFELKSHAFNLHSKLLTFVVYKIEKDNYTFSVAREIANSNNLADIRRVKEDLVCIPDYGLTYYPLRKDKEPLTSCYYDSMSLFTLFDKMYRTFAWDDIEKVIENHSLCGAAFVKMICSSRCNCISFMHILNGMIIRLYENGYTFTDIEDSLRPIIYYSYYMQKRISKKKGLR